MSFRGGIAYLNYFKKELAKPPSDFTPFASIIIPCKGNEENLAENLYALCEQDFPAYELIFVVDDVNDPAVPVIERILEGQDVNKLVIASKAIESSQKVENLREAVLHINERSEVFVFADSDARPEKDWLASLVAPLADESIGAATGYRWFISNRSTFASELCSAWNASIASALGPDTKNNFCWGGATAIRRELFDRIDMREKWRGTLSDDFALAKAVKAAGCGIYFVPQALTLSVFDCTFRECLEFTTRQMKITRVYATHLWLRSFFGSALFTGVMASAFLITIFEKTNGPLVLIALGVLAAVTLLSIGKAWLRMTAVRLRFRGRETTLRSQMFPQLTLWVLAPPLFLYNCIAALLSRNITWRSIHYELISDTETRVTRK